MTAQWMALVAFNERWRQYLSDDLETRQHLEQLVEQAVDARVASAQPLSDGEVDRVMAGEIRGPVFATSADIHYQRALDALLEHDTRLSSSLPTQRMIAGRESSFAQLQVRREGVVVEAR